MYISIYSAMKVIVKLWTAFYIQYAKNDKEIGSLMFYCLDQGIMLKRIFDLKLAVLLSFNLLNIQNMLHIAADVFHRRFSSIVVLFLTEFLRFPEFKRVTRPSRDQ